MIDRSERLTRKIEQRARQFDERMVSLRLRHLGVAFRRSGKNPLFAWDAWRTSRDFGLPLPDWAADVFDQWGRIFEKLSRKPGTRATEDVFQALGLAGGEGDKSAFSRYRKWHRDLRLTEDVTELLQKDPSLSLAAAFREVADRHDDLSPRTVGRACERIIKSR